MAPLYREVQLNPEYAGTALESLVVDCFRNFTIILKSKELANLAGIDLSALAYGKPSQTTKGYLFLEIMV